LVALGPLAAGCDALRSEGESPAEAAPAKPSSKPTAAAEAAPVEPPPLAGVLERAIVPPPEGGSTYRVDTYVAALVLEHVRRDPLPFTPWRNDRAEDGGPAAGYRVGPLAEGDAWSRLGLAEGDVIEEVNGVSTANPGWGTEALSRAENQVTVSIFRDGVSFVLSYRLMGGMTWYGLVQEQSSESPTEDEPPQVAIAEVPSDARDGDPLVGGGGGGVGGGGVGGGGGGGSSGSGARPSSPSGGKRPASPSSGGGSPRPGGATVAHCASESSCTLDKVHFDGLVRSPAKLESQAQVVPAIRNDVFSGYKLKSVRSGSAVDQLGFRSGDKITHINGYDLTNDMEAMQLYMGLSSTRTFKVRYVRGSSTRTKTITVK
ncbi:MAG: PDZ domain-containing protein, partial [Myxococcales bacterium]|nr:PDZ domain-containing protein [Myxococcales bacterium]